MRFIQRDLLYGWRKARRDPRFTLVVVLTLGLGIGLGTAVFSVLNAVLLKPLPYDDPERLAIAWNRMERGSLGKVSVSAPDVADLQERTTLFEGFAATDNGNTWTITGGERPDVMRVARVSANFFSVLGATPAHGRDFTAADDASIIGLPPEEIPTGTIILSHRFWQRYFGGDRDAIGRIVRVHQRALEVVGVMPADFKLWMPKEASMPTDIDAWTPLRIDMATRPRGAQWLRVLARLKEGVSLAQAQAEIDEVAAWQRKTFAFNRNMGIHVDLWPMHEDVVGRTRPSLLALFGAAILVLLIACANVAGLMLMRAVGRRREMAIRTALGATPRRIATQVMIEGLVLALLGGVAALAAAVVGVRLLMAIRPADLPRLDQLTVEPAVLGFALIATLLCTLLFSLAPALRAARVAPAPRLTARAESAGPPRLRRLLVIAQIAVALVLLIGAGLMLRSLLTLGNVQPGFQPEGATTYRLSLPRAVYPEVDQRVRFFDEMERRVAGLPGVQAVGAVFPLPLGGRYWTGSCGLRGESREDWQKREVNLRVITPGYHQALGARILRGRGLEPADFSSRAQVAVIDTVLAEQLWPGEDPLDREIGLDVERGDVWVRIVGVVEHQRHQSLRQDGSATVFFPLHLNPYLPMTAVVRAAGDPERLLGEIQATVHELDAELPLFDVRPLPSYVSVATADSRFLATLVTVFASLALILATVGLYGILAYDVRQRHHELGIRMALGATRRHVLRSLVGLGLLLAAAGLALGLAAAALLSRTVETLLYEVSPWDPLTYGLLTLLVLAIAFLASYLPARRASTLDPMAALRVED